MKGRCAECGAEGYLFFDRLGRRDLCRACYARAPRHPDLHGPLSSAAVSHIATCPACSLRVQHLRP